MKKVKHAKKRPVVKKIVEPSLTFKLGNLTISLNERLSYSSKEWKALQQHCEKRDGGKVCVSHGSECFGAMQLHHKKPLSKGGTNKPSNLEWICHLHHCLKHPFMIRDLLKKYYS